MKASFLLLLTILTCVIFSGCTTELGGSDAPISGQGKEPPAQGLESIDIDNYDALYTDFLEEIILSGIALSDWEDASKIKPDNLVTYYFAQDWQQGELSQDSVPAGDLELAVQEHFQVTSEQLQRSNRFAAEHQSYQRQNSPVEASAYITNAGIVQDTLILFFDVVSWGEPGRSKGGEVVIQFDGEQYWYKSCRSWRYEQDNIAYDLLNKKYLEDVFHSAVTAATWDDASQIEPDRLVNYYLIQLQKKDMLKEEVVPASEVEDAVRQHFDVSVEHLRKSSFYEPNHQGYTFTGWGGGAGAQITNARMNKDVLLITFDVYGNTRYWGGELSIKLDGEHYQYISCREWQYIEQP